MTGDLGLSGARRRDFGDAYNALSERYTGNLAADLSDYGIPADLAHDVARTCSAWATHRGVPAGVAAALAFHVGVMTGIEWARRR